MSKIYPEFKAQPGVKIIPEPIVIPEGNITPGKPLVSNQSITGETQINLPGSNVIRMKSDGTLYMEDPSRLPIMSFESIKTGTLNAAQTLTVGGSGATDWRVEISGEDSTYPIRYWNGTTVKFSLDDAGNVVISGTLTAGEIHIPSAATGVNSFHVDGSGNVWWSSVTLAAATTYIKSNGEASFYGQDVTLGDYAGGQGAKWDQGTGVFEVLGDITANNVLIGTGNNVFKADANGIYLGNATFGSAPFRVNMAGALTASSVDITGTIKALLDASNYVKMASDGGTPRLDLYTTGILRARLSGVGLTFYDSAGSSQGVISGEVGYASLNTTDLRVSTGASEVRIWADGVRVKEGKGFFCADNTGSMYLRMFVDASTHYGIIDLPTTDRLFIQDKASNTLIEMYGQSVAAFLNYGFIDFHAPIGMYTLNGFPGFAPQEGTMYWHSGTHQLRVYDGSVWRTVTML